MAENNTAVREPEEIRVSIDNDLQKTRTITDPFHYDAEDFLKFTGLEKNFKRRSDRLIKAANTAEASSKALIVDASYTSGYSLLDVVIPPYSLDELASFYENNAANHAAIDAKVANIVGMGYQLEITNRVKIGLEEKSDSARKKAHNRIALDREDITDWIESLNDDDTFTDTLKKVWVDYESVGNGYLEIGRITTGPRKGDIGYIGHIPATTVRVRRKKDGFVQIVNQNVVYFHNYQKSGVESNTVTNDPNPNEIIHFANYTPKNTYYGVPDVLSAAIAIVGDNLAGKYNIDYFENKAVPRYLITIKGGKLSRQAEGELFKFFQSGLRGQNHRTLLVPLPADTIDNKVEFKMEAIEAKVQEASFTKYHDSNVDDILMAHQMPKGKTGGETGVLAAALAQDRTFKEQVARPLQSSAEKRINKIIHERTNLFDLKLKEMTLTDEETQSMIDERYLRMKVIVPNEVRPRLGLPMTDWGSEVVEMKPEQAAEQTAQATGNRKRDQERTSGSDSAQTTSGRNPKGEGRSQA